MQAGDFECVPAGQGAGHALLNDGSAVCRHPVIGARHPAEVVIYGDSGRVGVRLAGEVSRRSATLDYREGLQE
jgi:uncharacterized cupin superfamily protein